MCKELNIRFAYDDKDGSFDPIETEYKDVNHAILAFCIASILYEENKKMPCFTGHVEKFIHELIEEEVS